MPERSIVGMDTLVAAVADWAINSAANRRVPLSAFATPTQQYALPKAMRTNHWSARTRDRRSKKERGHEHAHAHGHVHGHAHGHDTKTQTQLPAIAGATSHRKSPPPLEQHPLVPNTPASFGRPRRTRNHAGCTVHPFGIPMLPQHLVGHVPLSPEFVEQRRRGRSLHHGAAKRTRTQKQREEKTLETRRYRYEEDDEGTWDEHARKLKRKLLRAERGTDDQAALSSWSGSNNNHAGEAPTGHHMERSIDTQSKRHLGAIINQAMASFEDVRQSRQMLEQTSPSNERRGRRVGGNKQREVRRRRPPAMSAAGVARLGFSWIP